MSPVERYCAPSSLAEATEILHAGEVTVLAGGTDLMPQMQAGRTPLKRTLMSVRRVPELGGIAGDGRTIRIGALATISELMAHALVKEHLPLLSEAGDHFASAQLRNAATLGGNICNASPAGDMLVPLLVLEAQVELASKANGSVQTRRVPIGDFFTGPGRTRRAPAELLVAVHVPVPPAGVVARFVKFGTRPALDIAAISIGIAAVRRGDALTRVRVAFGAVAPTPLRATRTEAALEGRSLSAETIAAAATAARAEVHPISDVRASEWYRRELIHNLTRRVLEDVAAAGH